MAFKLDLKNWLWVFKAENRKKNGGTTFIPVINTAEFWVAAIEYSMAVPQNLNTEVPYDLTIPLLGIYSKEWKKTLEYIFIHAYSN